MPVNPFQATAEMQWGGYESKKSYRGQGQMGAASLGQGHRSQANNQGYTTGELKPTPQAKGTMPMGKADIGRPDYGRGAPAAPAREGRRTAFGGMGSGAVKGGGSGMTAGGNINFDLSIGKRDYAGADMKGARIAEEGSSAVLGDTKTDNRMYDNRKLEMNAGDGGDATSGYAKATGATPGATPGSSRAARAPRAPRTPEQRQTRNTRDRARRAELKASGTTPGAGTTATSGDAKGGAGGGFSKDALAVAERFISSESSMTNNATTNVGTGNSRDTSKKSSRSSRTDVRASGESVASADTSTTDARRTPAAKEKPAAAPAAKKPDKKATKAKTDETEKRSEIKDKARKDLAEATTTPSAPAAKGKGKGKGSKKKTAGKVTKEEEE